MPETYDEWRQFVGTAIEVLKFEVKHLHEESDKVISGLQQRIDVIFNRVNNGFSHRLTEVEHLLVLYKEKQEDLQATINGFKGFIGKVATALVIALIIAVTTGYIAMQNKSATLENQIQMLYRELDKKRNNTMP